MKSLTEFVNEASISQKKRAVKGFVNAFKEGKPGSNAVKTIVVFTAENLDTQWQSKKFNKKARGSLLNEIKDGKYAYVPAVGKFGNAEHPYAAFNMSLETAKRYNGKYKQRSFIYSIITNGTVHSEYWEKDDIEKPYHKRDNGYVLKDTCDGWEDKADADFTVVGKKFKYSIPFSVFESVNNLIYSNAVRYVTEERKHYNTTLTEDSFIDMAVNCVGYFAYRCRTVLTKGFVYGF